MDLQEYNAVTETLHLTSTAANHKRLSEAIDEMNTGGGKKRRLITK
jgi:antitoxin YefM